jgi:hypothetical protein
MGVVPRHGLVEVEIEGGAGSGYYRYLQALIATAFS